VADTLPLLAASAVAVGVVHTALGPDHYLPFIALARARRWSTIRTATITTLCGLAHVGSSLLLGLGGVALGSALFHLERVEAMRGDIAAWLMLGFGFAYAAWGVRQALRAGTHSHAHVHHDGAAHTHTHDHHREHLHPHVDQGRSTTAWALFLVCAFGPCEPLIPLLFYPAATGGIGQVAAVVLAFAVATLATMLALVFAGLALDPRRAFPRLARWEHALAGLVVALCGAAMTAGL
jgi:ABC-type nickel/cobalt efflux system permease component RcnA